MASKAAIDRLRKEFVRLQRSPPDHIEAVPLESDILTWHYVITGPADSPYAGGVYHGKIVFPPQYPFKPPSIQMHTPSGRFKTDTRLCLSMSDFHPESWNPLWSCSSILSGLLSFMLESTPTQGSIETSDATKRELAARSLSFNVANPTFRKLFPHWVERAKQQQAAATAAQNEPEAEQRVSQQQAASGLQRRTAAAADSSAAASAAAAASSDNSPAERRNDEVALFGDRFRLRESSLPGVLLTAVVAGTLIFCAIYLFGNK